MKDLHILNYVSTTLWAITAEKWAEVLPVLMRHARGETLTAEEIQARIGTPPATSHGRRGSVAVLPIHGVIAHRGGGLDESSGGTSTERIAAQFQQLLADDSVGTILLDCNSPGGTIPGVNELAAVIAAARGQKPIVAMANSLMASAAYWIASQADEIVSIPSGTIGSIGVFTAHQDLSVALEKEGIKVTLISAGKYKVAGNPFEKLSADEEAVIQARVDAAYDQFVKAVASGRGASQKAVRDGYGQGRALSAPEALKAGLIDRIETFDQTLGRLLGRKAATAGMRAEDADVELVAAVPPVLLDPHDQARRARLLL